MKLKTGAVIVFKVVFFLKKNITPVILFPFLFFQFHPKEQVPFRGESVTLSLPYPSNPGFLYIIIIAPFCYGFRFLFDFWPLGRWFYFLMSLLMHLNRCFLNFTQNFCDCFKQMVPT